MVVFYSPNVLETNALTEEESYHCTKVLRMREGDVVQVTDGKGNMYEAKIVLPDAVHTMLAIRSVISDFGKRRYRLHLAVAPTKNIDRFEWLVEKAVEIGVDRITPLLCQHSERRTVKTERLEKIALAAAKQSLKAYIPQIDPMTRFAEITAHSDDEQRFVAHCYDMSKENLFDACRPRQSTVVLIGPEGDFSTEEVEQALAAGFRSVSLSDSRLRTETAGIVAANIAAVRNM